MLKNRSVLSFCKNSKLNENSYVSPFSRVYNCEIGKYSSIGWFCLIQDTLVSVGVSIGSHCSIGALDHKYEFPVQRFSVRSFGEYVPKTYISSDVWIGSHVIIKSGVKIGIGAIVGSNSFVNKDVGDYEIFAGSPAKLIRKRFSDDIINRLLKLKPWEKSDEELLAMFKSNASITELLDMMDGYNGK